MAPKKFRSPIGFKPTIRGGKFRITTRRDRGCGDVNEWQIAGIKEAIASMDRGEAMPHEQVERWVRSWGREL